MADAEDVLLSAAERVSSATRRLWAEHRAIDPHDRDPAAVLRRLDWWLVACFGRSWPLVVCDRSAPAGWLRRALDRPAPWEVRPQPVAGMDGTRLLLPREALEVDGSGLSEPAHLAALALGQRLVRGAPRRVRGPLIRRDVCWALEAAQGDAVLATLLPGLGARLDRSRAAALAARPPRGELRSGERAVEELVRSLLRGPACAAGRVVAEIVGGGDADPIDGFARRFDARQHGEDGSYRGMAPVEHWGVPRDADHRVAASARPTPPDGTESARPRSRSLTRRVRRRPAREEGTRPGPFIVPAADPHLSVQDPRGVDRPEDRGDEDLDALADEISRLDELSTVRSERAEREVLQDGEESGVSPAARSPTPPCVESLCYPEWDFRRGAYRDPGVVLREVSVPRPDPEWAARVMQRQAPLLAVLRRQFLALRPRLERLRRQVDGDEIDLDGWVGEHAERLSGRTPDGRLYSVARPRRRDLAVALLVDASGSSDAWVSRDARVIDVAKEAALCFSEALSAVGDRHALYAFSGRGPGDVRVWTAKRFSEPPGPAARARIGGLQPDRSTRLGGPIRHVTAALSRVPAQTRILLVLSDGKPNDDDAYEGSYGVEDVRQAVHEAARAGVRSFCVTIDRRGPAYLPRLFGPTGYTLLWDAAQLPRRLPQIYRHLTRSPSG